MSGALSELRREVLFEILVDNPQGLTIDEMQVLMHATYQVVRKAINDLRAYLGEYDEFNLICNPQGGGERWLYELVGDYDGMRPWAANRVMDTETRLRTQASVSGAVVRGTDGRSIEGKKARLMHRSLTRLVEDLDTLALDGTLWEAATV